MASPCAPVINSKMFLDVIMLSPLWEAFWPCGRTPYEGLSLIVQNVVTLKQK